MYGTCDVCGYHLKHCRCTTTILPRQAGWEGGTKDDGDKPRMDLLDSYALEELSKVLTFGAKKYAPHNWRKGIVVSRLLAASCRHLFAIMRGEDVDEETGLAHAAHLMCCAMFLIWTMKNMPAMDDRCKNLKIDSKDEIKRLLERTTDGEKT